MANFLDLIEEKGLAEYINKNIDQNIAIRQDLKWEETGIAVVHSIDGKKNLYYSKEQKRYSNKNRGFEINFLKRQYRATMNFLMNNEMKYEITKGISGLEEDTLNIIRKSLDYVFEHKTDFYKGIFDNIIHYGLCKGHCPVYIYVKDGKVKIEAYDPVDCYIDLETSSLEHSTHITRVYVKDIKELEKTYTTDYYGEPVSFTPTKDSYQSDVKNSVIENSLSSEMKKNKAIVREFYFYNEEKKQNYKCLLTKDTLLDVTPIYSYSEKFCFNFFKVFNNPDRNYPQSWYRDFLLIEREVNDIIQKINHIISIAGRHVYVMKGTKIIKVVNDALNELGLDVYEVENAQEVPKGETLLDISPQILQHLDFLIEQLNLDGGMQHDILGKSTLGANASGVAIQSLQAGSQNNIGLILIEMNKFITKLTKTVLDYIGNGDIIIPGLNMQTAKIFKELDIKISAIPRTAFDEMGKREEVIKMIDLIKTNDPSTPIPYKFIIELFGFKNDLAEDLLREVENSENPDILLARAENMKMQNQMEVGANESDNQELHLMLHSELLKNFGPQSQEAQMILGHMRQHEMYLKMKNPPKK